MKKVLGFDQAIGGDGGKANGAIGIDGTDIRIEAAATFPLAKVIDPMMKVVDDMVDKIEKFIPGDQSAIAATMKAEARELFISLISTDKGSAPVLRPASAAGSDDTAKEAKHEVEPGPAPGEYVEASTPVAVSTKKPNNKG